MVCFVSGVGGGGCYHSMHEKWDSPPLSLHYMGGSIVMGIPQNGWFIMDNPAKMDDDWGYPHFRKPPYVY